MIGQKLKQLQHHLTCTDHARDMAERAILRAHYDIDRAQAHFANLMGRMGTKGGHE